MSIQKATDAQMQQMIDEAKASGDFDTARKLEFARIQQKTREINEAAALRRGEPKVTRRSPDFSVQVICVHCSEPTPIQTIVLDVLVRLDGTPELIRKRPVCHRHMREFPQVITYEQPPKPAGHMKRLWQRLCGFAKRSK